MTAFKAKDIAAVEAQLGALAEKSASMAGQIRSEVVWNDDGAGVVLAIYDSAAAAQDAAAGAAQIWGSIMPLLAGPPTTTEFSKAHIMK